MADQRRPQTNIRLPADMLKELGDFNSALKQVNKELTAAKREVKALERSGKPVGKDLTSKIAKAEKLKSGLVEVERKNKKLVQDVENTRRTGRAVRFILAASAFRQLAAGQILDPGAISSFAFGFQEVLDTNSERIFGAKSKITQGIKQFSSAAPAIGEAFAALIQASKDVKRQNKQSALVGTEFGRGLLSEAEFNLFKEANENQLFGDPINTLRRVQGGANAFHRLKKSVGNKIVNETIKKFAPDADIGTALIESFLDTTEFGKVERREADKLKQKFNVGTLRNLIENRITHEMRRQRRFITGKEMEAFSREGFAQFISLLPEELRAELIKNLEQAYAKQQVDVRAAAIEKSATVKWMEQEQEMQRQIEITLNRQRIAITGSVGYR